MREDPSAPERTMMDDNRMLHIIYGLYALTFIFTITAIAGVVVAYMQRGKALTSLQETHIVWQIRTFWITLLAWGVAFLMPFVLGWIGAFALVFVPISFFIYRIAKGWYLLTKKRHIDAPEAIF